MVNFLDDSDPQFQNPQVYIEGTWLYGAIVTALLYGIVLVLYVACCRSLWARIRSHGQKKHWLFLVYVNVLFALSTIYVAANSQVAHLAFISHRDYPGGPSAYEANTVSIPTNLAFITSNWCADAMMIWRCIVVYRDSRFQLIVTIFGWSMLLASVVISTLWIVIDSQPGQFTPDWMPFSFLSYLSVSLAINIFICTLTVVRLLYHRAWISKLLGPAYGFFYTSVAAMIIESAAVYSTCSLFYLIPYAVSSPLANAFLRILGEAQVIAPLLIIYRVSEGKAWSTDMTTRLRGATSLPMPMRPASPPPSPNDSQPRRPLDNVQINSNDLRRTKCTRLGQYADQDDKGPSVYHVANVNKPKTNYEP